MHSYHIHTFYSDGTSSPEHYVKEAIRKGLKSIAFSDHSPLPFKNTFSLEFMKLGDYKSEIETLVKQYSQSVAIYTSLEADYIPNVTVPFHYYRNLLSLDFIIGGIHMVKGDTADDIWFIDGPKQEIYDEGLAKHFNNDIKKAVRAFYYQTNGMIVNEKPDIIAHFDKIKMHNKNRFFREDEKWYVDLVMETISVIKESNTIVEINTRGLYKKRCDELFPSDWIIKELFKRSIPVVISADAHNVNDIDSKFDYAMDKIKEAGYKTTSVFNGKEFNQVATW